MRRRAALCAGTEEDSGRIAEHVLSLDEFRSAGGVFTFCGAGSEPDTRGIIAAALELRKRVFVPRCLGGGVMEAVEIRSFCDLVPGGRFGIPEPADGLEAADKGDIGIVLVPGVCFDPDGGRLGRGKGYYDRFLEGLGAVKAGLCFEGQLFKSVPLERHDVRMDIIVTQSRIIRCG